MIRFTLRLPAELHARLKKAAERDRRSIHAEILWLLEGALKDEEQLEGAVPQNR
jgi:hypothetical protein